MCILVLANHFMLYMNNIQVLRNRFNGYVDTVVTGLYTRWAELYKMYQEEVWGQDAQWQEGFDRLRELNEEKAELDDHIKTSLKQALGELTSSIHDMRKSRTSILTTTDICQKFAVMNVALFECLTKVVKILDQCNMLPLCNDPEGQMVEKLYEEVVKFVEGLPTDPAWYNLMSLPLEIKR